MIYDIPNIISLALPHAITPMNIIAGFSTTYIFPFIPDIFLPDNFLLLYSTDRPLDIAHKPLEQSTAPDLQLADQETLSKSVYQASSSPTCCLSNHKSLEDLKTVLKAGPRKESLRGRKRRKTCILTDIPEIKTLKEAKHSRNIKKTCLTTANRK
ncbi:hypothetical protein ILUMI_20110 [Ignelater luminosus]|uniref:Uncharacterized protein n=1 Tax=Ignelater luminosus TaxID=2038154 RepID=A0A8K0G4V4_IGNLU|nr:hypothetical protein ILUMI_20110 [Ignelater luminosus]